MDDRHMAAAPPREVIATHGEIRHWIEPWYGAYAILGMLASGLAVIAIPLVVTDDGGRATEIGTAIAALNIGALFAPLWGAIADRSKSYRLIFFLGFILNGAGFLVFTGLHGIAAWISGAFLIGFGTGASNTVASLFVVEFTPRTEWAQRISWLQSFNALGTVFGMALAGLLAPRLDTLLAALLVIPAIILGGRGLPVPNGRFHMPRRRLGKSEFIHLLHRSGPNAASVVASVHQPSWASVKLMSTKLASGFWLFLGCWFIFSLAVSSFASLYPVLMQSSFNISVAKSSLLMSIATGLSIPFYNYAGRLVTRNRPAAVLGMGIGVRMIGLLGLGVVGYLHLGWAMLPVVILFGLYQGVWPLLSVASTDLAAGLAPFGEGAAMGLFNAAAAIASAAGAVIGGKIADIFGYDAVSVFAGLVALAALGCAVLLIRVQAAAARAVPRQA